MPRLLLVVGLIVLLSSASVLRAENRSMGRVKVGALLTLSGTFAAAGNDCRSGLEAALAEAGDRARIQFVYADSKNEPMTALSEFRKLVISDQVSAVYLNRAAIGMPLNPLSASAGIPLLGALGHDSFVPSNKYALQTWPSPKHEGKFLADEFLRRGYKKVSLAFSEDEWTQASAAGFRSAYLALGGKLAADHSVLSSENDFSTLLLRLKKESPDAMYITLVLAQLGPFFRQAQALHINTPIFTNFYVSKKEVMDVAGADALEGVRFSDMKVDLPSLKKRLGLNAELSIPSLVVASYVAAHLLNQAAAEAASPAANDLYEALIEQREVKTVDMNFSIEDRYVIFPLAVKAIRHGRVMEGDLQE